MAADAVTKLGHHTKCGSSSINILPHIHRHYGQPDVEVADRHQQGTLDLKAYMALSDDGASASEGHDCSASLSCSRPDSKARGPCDIHGLVGGVCAHTVPLLGGFIDMRTPEQFVYYLILLTFMVTHVPQLRDVYIDFGCRLSITWARYLAGRLFVGADRIRIMVNWMHARGHEEACEAIMSARHFAGAARRVGENTEQLWSMLKVTLTAWHVYSGSDFCELTCVQLCQYVCISNVRVVPAV